MEGKELYSNEDEELNPQYQNESEDADDFGLPDIEDSSDDQEHLGDPYSDSTNYDSDADSSDEEYSYKEDEEKSLEDEYKPSYYEDEEDQGKSSVGWIIFVIVLVVAALGVGGYFLWDKYYKTEPVAEIPTVIAEPVVEDPEPEIIEEPEPTKQAGVYDISELTGNYHVIIASSIDVDLVRDYAIKLAKQGMVCNILAPRGNKMFHRLSVAEYASLNDATIESERLKSTLGDDVWVIRY